MKNSFKDDAYNVLADVTQEIFLLRKFSMGRDCNSKCGKKHQNLKRHQVRAWEFIHNLPSSSYSWKRDVNTLYSRVRHSYQWGHVSPSLTFYKASKENRRDNCRIGWGLKAKSWWIDSAVAKFIAFGHTFVMKIIFSPQKRFSSP